MLIPKTFDTPKNFTTPPQKTKAIKKYQKEPQSIKMSPQNYPKITPQNDPQNWHVI